MSVWILSRTRMGERLITDLTSVGISAFMILPKAWNVIYQNEYLWASSLKKPTRRTWKQHTANSRLLVAGAIVGGLSCHNRWVNPIIHIMSVNIFLHYPLILNHHLCLWPCLSSTVEFKGGFWASSNGEQICRCHVGASGNSDILFHPSLHPGCSRNN